jgi:hypothetical protein
MNGGNGNCLSKYTIQTFNEEYIIFCVQYIDHNKAFFKSVYYINKRRFGDLLHLQVV